MGQWPNTRLTLIDHACFRAALFLLICCLSFGPLGCSRPSPVAPSGLAATADVSGIWNGTSTLTAVTGGDCAADLIRGGITAFRRRMTISETGSSLTITLSPRGVGIADETWSGTIDADGRITATWQPASGGNSIDYICDPVDGNKTRRAVRRNATASFTYLPGSATIEGTVNSRSDVASVFGQIFPELVETTTERFTK
jgi:hypothetical protein